MLGSIYSWLAVNSSISERPAISISGSIILDTAVTASSPQQLVIRAVSLLTARLITLYSSSGRQSNLYCSTSCKLSNTNELNESFCNTFALPTTRRGGEETVMSLHSRCFLLDNLCCIYCSLEHKKDEWLSLRSSSTFNASGHYNRKRLFLSFIYSLILH